MCIREANDQLVCLHSILSFYFHFSVEICKCCYCYAPSLRLEHAKHSFKKQPLLNKIGTRRFCFSPLV